MGRRGTYICTYPLVEGGMPFTAKASTSGNSRALRLDAALVKSHPEFAKGEFAVHVLGPGTLLVTQQSPAAPVTDDDPALMAFLAFVDQDLRTRPDRVRRMTRADIAGLEKLLEGVVVERDEDLGNYTLP